MGYPATCAYSTVIPHIATLPHDNPRQYELQSVGILHLIIKHLMKIAPDGYIGVGMAQE